MNWLLTLLTLWATFQGASQETEHSPELMLARICGESFPLETAPARAEGIVRGQRLRWLEFPVSVFFSSRVWKRSPSGQAWVSGRSIGILTLERR